MKDIVVTKSFLTLNSNIRKCQHTEYYEDCTSNLFSSVLQDKCNCTLYSLRNSTKQHKVCAKNIDRESLLCIFFYFQQTCLPRDEMCVKSIWTNYMNGCDIPCEGIFADVKRLPSELTGKEMANMIPMDQYQIYKRFFQASSG